MRANEVTESGFYWMKRTQFHTWGFVQVIRETRVNRQDGSSCSELKAHSIGYPEGTNLRELTEANFVGPIYPPEVEKDYDDAEVCSAE